MRFRAFARGVLAVMLGSLITGAAVASAQESVSLAPAPAHTIALSRCGTASLSTAAADCRGFDARDIRDDTGTFVLGFENNQELGEKHVLQLILVFDLSQLALGDTKEVSHATLGYSEVSTTKRSAAGDSEYGILSTCATKLGVPTTEWDGSFDAIVQTRPALTAGATPATTGDAGSWDVTPQIQAWVAAGQQKGTLVMGAEDQSADIHEQAMCLSYLSDLGMTVEVTPKQ